AQGIKRKRETAQRALLRPKETGVQSSLGGFTLTLEARRMSGDFRYTLANALTSAQRLANEPAWFDAGQALVKSLVEIAQPLMVQPHQMQNGRVQVRD